MIDFIDSIVEFVTTPVVAAGDEQINDPMRDHASAVLAARLSALDWMACGLAGQHEPVAEMTRHMVLSENGGRVNSGPTYGQAAMFGGGFAPPRAAALVNGTTSHALDYDDTHFAHIGHPSVAVFPAVMALAQQQNVAIYKMLHAALIGMEVSIRVGMWLGRSHYQAGFHQTATAGCFGAAAGAAQILGLTATQIGHAISLAATRASGLKAQFGTMGKPYNAGMAAASGVEVALLAQRGFQSTAQAVSGEFGFGRTHHGEGNPWEHSWQFQNISHKFHACCHGLHAALEALREIDVTPSDVSKITVYTNPRWLTVCNQFAPDTGLGAKFSYRAAVALAICGHDTGHLDTFRDGPSVAAPVIAVRDLIQVVADTDLSEQQARLEIRCHDGQQITGFHDLQRHLDMDVRTQRVQAKASGLIGVTTAQGLIAALADDQAHMSALTSYFQN
jgi:2-methylcitrate dehydratase PrpD